MFMATILALDTSTDACSVALYQNGKVSSLFELAAKSHTQRLLPMVDEILQAHQLSLHQLDAIAYGRGPGSFTGLRICMGVVQGLAFGANLPVIPISTLSAMAVGYWYNLPATVVHKPPVLVALDARMNEIYWSLLAQDPVLLEPKVLAAEAVAAPSLVIEHSAVLALQDEFVGLGQGWHYPALEALKPYQILLDAYPHAEAIARLGAEHFARGAAISVMDASPVYLRDSVSWQKRQRIRAVS